MNKKTLSLLGAGGLTLALLCTPTVANASSFGPAATVSAASTTDPIDRIDSPEFDFVTRSFDRADVRIEGLPGASFIVTDFFAGTTLESGVLDGEGRAEVRLTGIGDESFTAAATQSLQGLTSAERQLGIPGQGAPSAAPLVSVRERTVDEVRLSFQTDSQRPGHFAVADSSGRVLQTAAYVGGATASTAVAINSAENELDVFFVSEFHVRSAVSQVVIPAFDESDATGPAAPAIERIDRNAGNASLSVRTAASGTIVVRNSADQVIRRELVTVNAAHVTSVRVSLPTPDATTVSVSFVRNGIESARVPVQILSEEAARPAAPTVAVAERTAADVRLKAGVVASREGSVVVYDEQGARIASGFKGASVPTVDVTARIGAAATTLHVATVIGNLESARTPIVVEAAAPPPAPVAPSAPLVTIVDRTAASAQLSVVAAEAGTAVVRASGGAVIASVFVARPGVETTLPVRVSAAAQTLQVTLTARGLVSDSVSVDVPVFDAVAPPATPGGPSATVEARNAISALLAVTGPASRIEVLDARGRILSTSSLHRDGDTARVHVPLTAAATSVDVQLVRADGSRSEKTRVAIDAVSDAPPAAPEVSIVSRSASTITLSVTGSANSSIVVRDPNGREVARGFIAPGATKATVPVRVNHPYAVDLRVSLHDGLASAPTTVQVPASR